MVDEDQAACDARRRGGERGAWEAEARAEEDQAVEVLVRRWWRSPMAAEADGERPGGEWTGERQKGDGEENESGPQGIGDGLGERGDRGRSG